MSPADFQAISPLLVLSAGATLVMLQIAFLRSVTTTAWLSTGSLVLAALSCAYAWDITSVQVTPLLLADRMALLFCVLFSLGGAMTVQLSREYIRHHGDEPEEYFLLLILSTLGACVLAYAVHLASLLLGLELLSVALYALIAYPNIPIAISCRWRPPPSTWFYPAPPLPPSCLDLPCSTR
jgi:NADH-quinone oxidoreductase subunit N